MNQPEKSTKMVHRMLEGDGVQFDHPQGGTVEVFIESVRGQRVKLSIKAPRSVALTWVHMNPNRGEEVDPSPYCTWCGATKSKYCECGPRAAND
jgi:hypothetical protein